MKKSIVIRANILINPETPIKGVPAYQRAKSTFVCNTYHEVIDAFRKITNRYSTGSIQWEHGEEINWGDTWIFKMLFDNWRMDEDLEYDLEMCENDMFKVAERVYSEACFGHKGDNKIFEHTDVSVFKEQDHVSMQYHGLQAFTNADAITNLQSVLECTGSICGSNVAIGDVGIVFEGDMYRVFDRDVYSSRKSRDNTISNKSYPEEYFFNMAKENESKRARSHMETFSSISHVLAIWVDDISQWIKDAVAEIATKLGVPVINKPKNIGLFESVDDAYNSIINDLASI